MVTSVPGPEISREAQQHPLWAHVSLVCNSQCFHSSHRLKDFLLYVADCALRNAPDEATEQHIGIHVFQRTPGYNSSDDSIVRTHARLLRQKLAEYYAQEGAENEILIEIPKGHYLPVFRSRDAEILVDRTESPAPAAEKTTPEKPVAELPIASQKPVNRRLPALLLIAGLCLAFAVSIVFFRTRTTPVDRFWAPFLADNAALVIYSNAVFTGNSTTGLKYAPPQDAREGSLSGDFVDTYTGIGELASVYDLTQLFDQHHARFLLKRSMLVTWDEARGNNLIFLGSVAENSSLRVLPTTGDFTMTVGNGYAGFINTKPKPGEPAVYTRPEHPLSKDYAILALLPGLQPGKTMLVFSGLTTFGTQAAVEFACHRDTAEQLLNAAAGPHGEIRPFEALLETTIGGGVPLQTRMVSFHLR